MKGAYLSTTFSSLVVERNLIYLTPLVFVGTALLLERLDTPWWAAVPAGALVLWAVAVTPTKIELYPYYEAHGLSILALGEPGLGVAERPDRDGDRRRRRPRDRGRRRARPPPQGRRRALAWRS